MNRFVQSLVAACFAVVLCLYVCSSMAAPAPASQPAQAAAAALDSAAERYYNDAQAYYPLQKRIFFHSKRASMPTSADAYNNAYEMPLVLPAGWKRSQQPDWLLFNNF